MVKKLFKEVIDLDVNGRNSAVVTFQDKEKVVAFTDCADLLEAAGHITCYDPITQRVIFQKVVGGYWSVQYQEWVEVEERSSMDIREYLREMTWQELGKLFETV